MASASLILSSTKRDMHVNRNWILPILKGISKFVDIFQISRDYCEFSNIEYCQILLNILKHGKRIWGPTSPPTTLPSSNGVAPASRFGAGAISNPEIFIFWDIYMNTICIFENRKIQNSYIHMHRTELNRKNPQDMSFLKSWAKVVRHCQR